MAEKEEIELLISPEGDIKFHMKGIKGPGCAKTARELAADVGEITEMTPTSEYYQNSVVKSSVQSTGRKENP